MNLLLNEHEQGLLLECSLEARSLYVLSIRPLVDVRTGLVGRVYPVSVAQLGLNVAYRPPQGSRRPAWLPTRKQTENLIDELERVRLVRRAGLPQDGRRLVLRLPFFEADCFARPKYEGEMNGQCGGKDGVTGETRAGEGFEPVFDAVTGEVVSCDEGAISGYRCFGDKTSLRSNHLSGDVAREDEHPVSDEVTSVSGVHEGALSFDALPELLDSPELIARGLQRLGWGLHTIKATAVWPRLRGLVERGGVLREVLRDAQAIAESRNASSPGYVLSVVDSLLSEARPVSPLSRRGLAGSGNQRFDPAKYVSGGV
ncbi:hypothetical protein A9J41_14165 [Laribacter hongkongensis]|uniref:hypothetical protein n=1 Tax=Laribacter hongkongensis TaxID=168471 RepID=UPI0018776112|nr:hypothetical protein [Laribacter hongkongensis]MBE5528883.1 hypothetical protein [Laribacter hongkongensis]